MEETMIFYGTGSILEEDEMTDFDSVEANGDFIKTAYYPPEQAGWIAEDCARNYYDYYDGWEDDWPIDFTLFLADGTYLGRFRVYVEVCPEFNARKVEDEESA